MEIHMIGHASIFVKTKDCRILMDPVLWDPFYGGVNEVCPKREVIPEKLPEFDFLVISHKHLDHFDIRTLAYLPKTVDVLIPRDKLIEDCLRELGYSQIYPLKDFSEVRMGSTSLLTTRSENRVPEYGMIFADESGIFWNQVDTIVSSTTINLVLSRYSSIDFLLARWHPNLETNYQFNQNISFPHSAYNQLLYNISLIQPKALAPGANGVRYINSSSWLNRLAFPVTFEQFRQDAKNVSPSLGDNIFDFTPGDIVTVENGGFNYLSGQCSYIQRLEDDRETLDFCPVKLDSDLIDTNPENYDIEEMKNEIEKEISSNLTKFIVDNRDSLFREHCRWKVIYQLEVVFPNGCQTWWFDFSQDNIQAKKGRNPLSNLFAYITASSFYGFLQKALSLTYIFGGGYGRSFIKVYEVTPLGLTSPEMRGIIIEDPLLCKLNSDDTLNLRIWLQREIEKWGGTNTNKPQSTKSKNSMLKIGDIFLKPTEVVQQVLKNN